jgi:hypothetical protein
MFLPIRLTWNLQMPKAQKVGVFVLFGSGFVCIAFATLRVVRLGIDGRGKTTTPEPKWMLLWTVLECSMGTDNLPAFIYTFLIDASLSHHYWLLSGFRSVHPEAAEQLEEGLLQCRRLSQATYE